MKLGPADISVTNCEQEPIHIPGSIQPFGVLLALTPKGEIEQISANASDVFADPAEALLGKDLASLLQQVTPPVAKWLTEKSQGAARAQANGKPWNVFYHQHRGQTLVEFERPSLEDLPTLQGRMRTLTQALQNSRTLLELCHNATRSVLDVSGFDRVMLYRFDDEWNGEVVAESISRGTHSYLGHYFPASDIPKQAREMLTTNIVRMIPDSSYRPVPLVPVMNPRTQAPLDMGQSLLRSVSPVHLQYLKNMEVGASLTVTLMYEGKLCGLIACHNSTPRHVPHEDRFTCEMVGRIFSSLIPVKLEEEGREQKKKLQEFQNQLTEFMRKEEDLGRGLVAYEPTILDLANADGAAAAVYHEGGWRLIGNTPSVQQIEELVNWLKFRMGGDPIFHTHSLPSHFPIAEEYKDKACGIMAIAIPKTERNFVLWFRPEVLEIVTWAGDPKKNVEQLADGTFKIEPRFSFEAWKETQRLKAKKWTKAEIEAACELRASIIEIDLHRQFVQTMIASEQLKAAKESAEAANTAKSSFLANMSHEIRTPLGAIMGFVGLLKDKNITRNEIEDYVAIIDRNSSQLLRIIDDILDLSKVEAGLMQIEKIDFSLVEVLTDFSSLMGFKAREKGIGFSLRARTPIPDYVVSDPTRIRQILANIVGNAIKFTNQGHVELSVAYQQGKLEFEVLDTGPGISKEEEARLFQPFVQADVSTTRKYGGTGLGLVLTRRLSEAMGGEFKLKESKPGQGSVFAAKVEIEVPNQSKIVNTLGFSALPQNKTPTSPLEGMQVLVVEDSPDNQALVSIILSRAGAKVDIASDGGQGMRMALADDYDAVLMDVQMPVMDGITATKGLRAQGYDVPIIALTAHAMKEERERCLEAGFSYFLSKPIHREQLVDLLNRIARQAIADD